MPENPIALSAAVADYGHTKSLKTGRVAAPGFDLQFREVDPIIAAFRRMIRELEFDVCELAPTTYLVAREAGIPIKALPVFLMRRFHHGDVVCRPDSGIVKPKDLNGRKIGVRAYTVSTGVWVRGILEHEYGVDPAGITWIVDDEEHVTSYQLPPNVIKTGEGVSIAQLFEEGGIDAALTGPAGIGRSGAPAAGWAIAGAGFDEQTRTSGAYPLFPDSRARETEWFARTGIYPIHGLVVVKEAVLQRHPEVARVLTQAFEESKKDYLAAMETPEDDANDSSRYAELKEIVGNDPLPYGIDANRASLDALIEYALTQRILTARPSVEELFAS